MQNVNVDKKLVSLLKKGLHGIERESLRCTSNGQIATTMHPKELGSPLDNPNITTDFSESQIEIITSPCSSIQQVQKELKSLHKKVAHAIKDELLWPFSMPCIIADEKINIAQFGDTQNGKEKTKYREGLAFRYGKQMQTISGIHYNYSFDEKVFAHIGISKTDAMMGLVRNFIRIRWILTYLLGASPVKDKSYTCKNMDCDSKNAVSLRLSRAGYSNPAKILVDFNNYKKQISDIKNALNTYFPAYDGHGLNANLLQIPAEYYFSIRLKPILGPIEYVEVRMIDVDPYEPLGISKNAIFFINLVLIDCMIRKSPKITKNELESSTKKQQFIALNGRKIKNSDKITIANYLKSLEPLAKSLGKNYEKALNIDMPWEKIVNNLEKNDFINLGLSLAKKHKSKLLR